MSLPSLPIEAFVNHIMHGDCQEVMRLMPPASVDLVVTDPPYIVRYTSRDGRTYANDDNARWVQPAFAEIYRVLKPDSLCVSFYGWAKADVFLSAWRVVGFRLVGHFVWTKTYNSRVGYTQGRHESAYLLAKGQPQRPAEAPSDVLHYRYTGNVLHPTQKPVDALLPLIAAYSKVGDIVLDPFAGSGTTAVAARQLRRRYIAIEKVAHYHAHACTRLGVSPKRCGEVFTSAKRVNTRERVPEARTSDDRAPRAQSAPRGKAVPIARLGVEWGRGGRQRLLSRMLWQLRERLIVMLFVMLVFVVLLLCDSPLARVMRELAQ